MQSGKKLYFDFIKEPIQVNVPIYSWANVKNRKAMRLIQFWGQKFDGLYDFVYEKLPAAADCSQIENGKRNETPDKG